MTGDHKKTQYLHEFVRDTEGLTDKYNENGIEEIGVVFFYVFRRKRGRASKGIKRPSSFDKERRKPA